MFTRLDYQHEVKVSVRLIWDQALIFIDMVMVMWINIYSYRFNIYGYDILLLSNKFNNKII